jgi:transposase
MGFVDTLNHIPTGQIPRPKNRRRTILERREIVEQTLLPGASVSRVARQYDVNANQVFHWRRLYQKGRLGVGTGTQLLPVKVTSDRPGAAARRNGAGSGTGSLEIQLSKGIVRVAGNVDVVVLRTAIECLIR